ncbi:DinB family protein [Paenibacillus sp. FSL K6-0108]|uniref:DinB family protein n=1 Tax=Paenibacillus sp. FSL K6-0108 TaxID=2921417 RepID=UPI003252AEA3
MKFNEDVLWNQLLDVRQFTLGVCGAINSEQVDVVPQGFNNSIRWNVGHIILDQDTWFHYLIEDEAEIPATYEKFFGFGTSPSTWAEEPPTWKELMELLKTQPEVLKLKFSGRLEEPLQRESELGMSTIGEIIPRTLYHEWYHLGYIQSIRRCIDANAQ